MPDWNLPPGGTGDTSLVRIFPSAARDHERECPMYLAAKARPGVRPTTRTPYNPAWWEGFSLGPAMTTLDHLEFKEESLVAALETETAWRADGVGRVHPGLGQWTSHAAQQFMDALAAPSPLIRDAQGPQLDLVPPMTPIEDPWVARRELSVPDSRGVRLYEMCAWGRRYASADGSVRELRIPVAGNAEDKEIDLPQVAVAASVLALGSPALLPEPRRWSDPATPVVGLPPERLRAPSRVRIVRVGCLDGSMRVEFDGTVQEARELFAELGGPQLAQTVEGTDLQPGYGCASCKWADACPTLVKIPSLVGIADSSRPRRTWSMTDGRAYRRCPSQEHLYRLRLPRDIDVEHTAAVRRGHAIHGWLQEMHERQPPRRCTTADLPDDPADWTGGSWTVTGEQALLGAAMIAQHARYCPMGAVASTADVRNEELLTAYDVEANLVLVAKADLMYRENGSWVYREIKTQAVEPRRRTSDYFWEYPQLALAVILLASGVPPGERHGCRVELEILGAQAPQLVVLDASDPDNQRDARAALRSLTLDWHGDHDAAARPGRMCTRCSVARWCPDAADPLAIAP